MTLNFICKYFHRKHWRRMDWLLFQNVKCLKCNQTFAWYDKKKFDLLKPLSDESL